MEVSVIRSFKAELAYRELGFCNLKDGKTVISSKNRVCFGRSTGWRKSGIRFTLRATAAIQSEPLRSDSVSGRSRRSKSCNNVRLFVGLPLDAISDCNTVNHARAIAAGLKALKLLGVEGVELPVWWGTVEKEAMGKYEWSGYLALAEMVQNAGLKLHVSLCFHASKQHKISLPEWVSRIGESEPSIFFTDRAGQQYKECLSLAVDDLPVLDGKTPVQVYREFCESFKSSFSSFMGSTITGVSMGLGPDSELQYPSHQRLVKSNKITGDKGRYWINCFCSHGQTNFAELLNFYKFPGDEIPIVRGSALSALQGTNEELGKKAILKLMDAVDQYIADPVRQLDKPFLMPIEDVFSIQGRGTVVTGRVEQGTIKVGEEVEVLGLMQGGPLKTTVTGVEMFKKILDHGQAGDNVGLLLRGLKRDDVQRGMVISKPGAVKTYKKFEAEIYVLTKDDKILRNCAN